MIYDTLSAKWRSLTAVNHPYLGASPGVNRQQENIAGKAVPSVGRWLAPGAVAHRHQAATNGHPSRMLTCGNKSTQETGTQTEWQGPPYLASATWGILRDATAELTPIQQARILLAANVVMTNIMDPVISIREHDVD